MKIKFLFKTSYHGKQKCKIYIINRLTIVAFRISKTNNSLPNNDRHYELTHICELPCCSAIHDLSLILQTQE
jgi:hypothetical protein